MPADGGLVRAGMTQVGVTLAREVIVFTPKRPKNSFEKAKAFATVESAKWIGSVRAAFDGAVEAFNEGAQLNPALINSDCYGAGWLLLVRPASNNWQDNLIAGDAVASQYEAWMESEAFPGCDRG